MTTTFKASDVQYWLTHPVVRIIFLAASVCTVFYIAEHDPTMASIENFVIEIDIQEKWADGGNPLRRFGFLGCAFLGIVGLLFGRWRDFRPCLPVYMMAAYVIWCGVSYTWSVDPVTSLRRFILMLCTILGCVGLTRFFKPIEILYTVVLILTTFMISGIGMEILAGAFHPHRGAYRFAGTIHPNSQAAHLSMLCLTLYTLMKTHPKRNFYFYSLFGFAVIMLILTKSRTATLAMFVGLGVIWLLSQDDKRILIFSAFGSWLLAMGIFAVLATGFDPTAEYSDVLLMGRAEETGSSLTGRLPLWTDLATYIADRPWFGHGFSAFWDARHIYEVSSGQQWTISEAHSSYVDATLQVGLIGCALMVLTAFSTFWWGLSNYRATHETYFLFIVAGVVFVLIRSFSESGLSDPRGFSSSLFLVVFSHCWQGGKDRSTTPEVPSTTATLQPSVSRS